MIGNDGIRYYGSHLQTVAEAINVGDKVTAGHVLGTVGNSGNARGLDCHVHFGISQPTEPGDWIIRRGQLNPYPYLQAWERGENLTPVLQN
ncbi:MAG: peptidoglycan DD-metalloendopeptidase family protein [Anaerolineales bacterium]|nr:peptidoglycan DD-metalloendopeptidase family protein [Anaerolineales bacterium]